MYELLKKEGLAKRGRLHTVHGTIETPVFMNVGTAAAIKGAVSTDDLRGIKTQVELSNTYHLHVRPGDQVVKQLGGLHKFMNWDKPILTDSGGFQVFSLAGLRKIKEEGVHFHSHIDGKKIFMGPEESMQIQSNLAALIDPEQHLMRIDRIRKTVQPLHLLFAARQPTGRPCNRLFHIFTVRYTGRAFIKSHCDRGG